MSKTILFVQVQRLTGVVQSQRRTWLIRLAVRDKFHSIIIIVGIEDELKQGITWFSDSNFLWGLLDRPFSWGQNEITAQSWFSQLFNSFQSNSNKRILKYENSRSFTVHLIKIGMLTLHQLSLLNRCVMTF